MNKVARRSLERITLTLCFIISNNHAIHGNFDNDAEVRDRISAAWRDFDSFECRSTDQIDNQSEEHNRSTTIDFSWKNDGRSALVWTREQANKTTHVDVREDGTRRASLQYFDTPPKAINRVLFDRVMNRPGHYGGIMFSALWAILPGGKTIAANLEGGGILDNKGTQQHPQWSLTIRDGKQTIECDLDETHQFLPKRVTVDTESDRQIVQVDRFEQTDGYWHPAAGKTTFLSKKGLPEIHLTFEVESVAINHAIAQSKFELTDIPAGVDVDNRLTNSTKYTGGKAARLKLLGEHPVIKSKPPTNDPFQVPADAGALSRRWMMSVLIGVAILAGGSGFYLRRRDG